MWGARPEKDTDCIGILFYRFSTVIEVNRHKCISVGILSMLSDLYNNMYDPVSGENK